MAANKVVATAVVSMETRISIAELRSKFQKEEKSLKSTLPNNRNNLINRSPNASPTPPSHQPASKVAKEKIIRCTSTDINAAKSKLNKVETKIIVSPQVRRKDVVVIRASPELLPKPVQLVPNVALKPNRSHLSALIFEVQQNQNSKVEEPQQQQQQIEVIKSTTKAEPPPLPPWPSGIKSAALKDINVKLKVLPPVNNAGPPPPIPFRPSNVNLKTVMNNTPPLPQRNNEKNLSEILVKVSASPIPEYTEEQELGGAVTPDDLYGDAEAPLTPSVRSNSSSCSHNQLGIGSDDIYQDSYNPNEEVYEDVANSYDNSHRMTEAEIERSKKKQLKEAEKKRREIQKSLERFGLTGNEVEVQAGTVKEATKRKRKGDLQAQAGERISIIKISGTPVGRWLVRNFEGQVGYMDLINIEVNADSVRSVMRQSKTASSLQIGYRESMDFYSDGLSEAIYEEFS